MDPQKERSTFISYSRVNTAFARKLALELRAAGFDIWLDQLDIPPGSRWDDEVENALARCEIFMVILTPASMASDNVKDEIGYAIDTRKRILPILLENATLPLRLRRFQYVDFTSKSFDDGIEDAKQLLKRLIDEPTQPNLQIPAPFRTPEMGAIHEAQEPGEGLAVQQVEAERLASQRAEEERIRKEEMEAQRLAAEKAEAERKAKEEVERKAREKAEAERIAKEKKEAERLAAIRTKEELKARKETERVTKLKVEKETPAQEKRELEGPPLRTENQSPKVSPAPIPQSTTTTSVSAFRKPRLPLVIGAVGAGVVVVLVIVVVAITSLFSGNILTIGALENNLSAEQTGTSSEPVQVVAERTSTPALEPTDTLPEPAQTSGPVILSSAETEKEIQRNSYKAIFDIAREEYSQDAINVFIDSSTPVPVKLTLSKHVAVRQGWCATNQSILQDNLTYIKISFEFDGRAVPEDRIFDQYFTDTDGWECYRRWIMIDKWKSGQYFIDQEISLTLAVNDGQDDYEPFTSKITWKVELP